MERVGINEVVTVEIPMSMNYYQFLQISSHSFYMESLTCELNVLSELETGFSQNSNFSSVISVPVISQKPIVRLSWNFACIFLTVTAIK